MALLVLWGDRGEDYSTAAPDQSTSLCISSFPSPRSQPSLSILLFTLTPVVYTLLKSPSCPQRVSLYSQLAKPPQQNGGLPLGVSGYTAASTGFL